MKERVRTRYNDNGTPSYVPKQKKLEECQVSEVSTTDYTRIIILT